MVCSAEGGAKGRPVVFMFPGQGAHSTQGLGSGLYEHEPVFRKEVTECCELLKTAPGIRPFEACFIQANSPPPHN